MNRLRDFATSNGFIIVYETKEIASGMNDTRPKLGKLLTYEDWDVLIVENKERLTRFGFNYIETLLNTKNKEILVVNKTEDNEKKDLIEDLVSIIYSFSARIYGLRKGRTVSNEIKNKLK
jgi:predicted site-specific integrase-resolvase